tara:strand:+ start:1 stop:1308 length:1308 start_codon:yes stop_codon:yes gene_type:complete
MNVYKSSFLIIGKGETYKHCKNFFDDNSISYKAIVTNDALKVKNMKIIIKPEHQRRIKQKEIDLENIDYVIVSPGIPKEENLIRQIIKYKCKIITDIEIIQSIIKSKFICITGTNGKTSTVTLLADILNANKIKSIACGNNGISVFEALNDSYEYVILEISSYQLEYIENLKSEISVILNITSDHLDRHNNFGKYKKIKSKILKNAKHTITNNYFTSKNNNIFDVKNNLFYINNIEIKYLKLNKSNYIEYKEKKYAVTGKHEALNLCACISILKIIKINLLDILDAFNKRTFMPHRMEVFNQYNNITFINDSKSTNVSSTNNALISRNNNIILIMGGDNKKSSYVSLTQIINEKVKLLILIGENRLQLDVELSVDIKKKLFMHLKDASSYIFSEMQPGDTVLLSPGSSSFYMYNNYIERGVHFKKLINDYVYSKD